MSKMMTLACFINLAFTAVLPLGLVFLFCGCAGPMLPPAPSEAVAGITPEAFARHVAFLADPTSGGRMTATPGDDRAAEYVASEFAAAGLKPGGPEGDWFQSFPLSHVLVPGSSALMEIDGSPQEAGKDYYPIAAGRDGAFDAPVVFAGYGLHNHLRGYNDYASLSARGAVVMVLQGEPHDAAGRSDWMPAGGWTHLASTEYKLRHAAEEGAVAVLLVTPPDISPADDPLEDVLEYRRIGIPAVRISRELADRLLKSSGRKSGLDEIVRQIRETGTPASFALGCRAKGVLNLVPTSGRNVIALLPACSGPGLTTVVVAAHHDHLPATGQKAWDRGFGVRPGADDNASGTAALIMLAGALRRVPDRKCNYVFLSTTAEEVGFQGSTYYVAHPTVPLKSIAFMVNIDQIGFVRHNQILLLGQPDSPSVAGAVAMAERWYNPGLQVIRIPIVSDSRWSDQAPFVRNGIKVLFFYAGSTKEHHARTDTADRLNNDGAARTVRLVMEVLRHLDGVLPQAPGGAGA